VSRERLHRMLEYEHNLNLERLGASRGDTTSFFTFADTVADRSAERDNFAKLNRIEFQLRHVPVDHVDKELGEEIRGTKSKEAGRPWFAERYWESFPVNER